MKTAARATILASLLGVACSGEAGDGQSMAGLPSDMIAPMGTIPGAPADPNAPVGVIPGVTPGDPTATPTSPGTDPVTGVPLSPDAVVPTVPGDPAAAPPTPLEPIVAPTTGACQPGVPITSQIPRLTNLQYDAVVRDLFEITGASGSWSATFEPDSNGELPSSQWAQYRTTAEQIAAEVMATPQGEQLIAAASDAASLESSIRSLGRKAFRRPLTDAEVASFMTLADVEPAGEPAEIAEAIVYTLLISPSFLTRTELDAPEAMVPGTEAMPQTAFQLSNYEVASRLSFLIWNSIPDATLDAAAEAGELQTKEQIQAQAQRMLGEEFRGKVAPVIGAAHRFYANIIWTSSTSRWGKTQHVSEIASERFPEYSPAQDAPMMDEIDMFFEDVGFSGQFQDLFLSNVAYVNQDTAPLYGLASADFGPELERTTLDGAERPGFLTRAAFLSSYAQENRTSPILRGAFILTLMGGQAGVPSADALTTAQPEGDYATNREATTALTSVDPSCIACHQANINPPGFVLENFSAVGSIQTTDPEYRRGPIVTAVESVNFPAGPKPINNAFELMTEIVAGRATKEIYAKKWVSYATGRESNDFDQCTANLIADKIDAGAYNLASVLADLTQAESFRLRVAAE
jgi:hypothetical protein